MIDENKSDDQVHIICEPSLKTSQNYPSYKSNSTDITSIKDNIIKNEKIYKIISPKRSLETANDVRFS